MPIRQRQSQQQYEYPAGTRLILLHRYNIGIPGGPRETRGRFTLKKEKPGPNCDRSDVTPTNAMIDKNHL
jgi:hypothetical protein